MNQDLSLGLPLLRSDSMSPDLLNPDLLDPDLLDPDLLDMLSKVNASPSNSRLQLDFADALRQEGRGRNEMEYILGALHVYDRVLKQFPDSKRAALALAMVSYEVGLFDKAEQYFRKVYLTDSDSDHIRIKLGFAILAQGRREDALKMFGDELRLKPDSALGRLGEELCGQWVVGGMSGDASLDSRRESVLGAIDRLSETESPEVMQLILESPVLKNMLAQTAD